MRGIGLMGNMMAMESRLGQEVADIEANIDRDLGMVLGFIDFILAMYMLGSGPVGKAMGAEYIHARMEAAMLENSSGVLSMASVTTISEMVIHMLENTLQTRCMVSASILLPMVIIMRVLGMRVDGKGLACTLLEMGKLNLDIGRKEFLIYRVHKAPCTLILQSQSITLKCSTPCRKHEEQRIEHMTWPRLTKGLIGLSQRLIGQQMQLELQR